VLLAGPSFFILVKEVGKKTLILTYILTFVGDGLIAGNDENVAHIIKSVEKGSSCEGSCNLFIGMSTIRGRGEAVLGR
jgi:hypothetical protein